MQHKGLLGYLQATSQGTDCGRLLLIPLLRTPTEPTLSYHILCPSRAITHGGRPYYCSPPFAGHLLHLPGPQTRPATARGVKGSDASDHQYRGMPIRPSSPPAHGCHGMWLLRAREGGLMDSLFERGYHGRRNKLILEAHGMGHWPVELVINSPQLDDILGKIAPARQPASALPARCRRGEQTAF